MIKPVSDVVSDGGPESRSALVLDYYQPTFKRLTETKSEDIKRALFTEPRELRRRFLTGMDREAVFAGSAGHEVLVGYMNSIDDAIGRILRKRSLQFWLHLYRRISPMLAPGHESKTDSMTALLVRDHVECAIAKHGLLSAANDLRRSSSVSASAILGGRFERDVKSFVRDPVQSRRFVRSVIAQDQIVLVKFKSSDFVDMYRVEGLAYEFWLTTAQLRAIGKGDRLRADAAGEWIHLENPDLDVLIESYDLRIGSVDLLTPRVGTFVSAVTEEPGSKGIFTPVYNTSRDRMAALPEELKVHLTSSPYLNFAPGTISVAAYHDAHPFLADCFLAQRGYSLRAYLLVIAALSWRVVLPERSIRKFMEGETRMPSLSLLNALQRAYCVIVSDLDSIRASTLWYLEYWLRCGPRELADVAPHIDAILRDLTLDSPGKQSSIALWSRGPRYMLLAVQPGQYVVDAQGVIHILETLFFRLRHAGQDRGTSFEERVRDAVTQAGHELLPLRKIAFPHGPREIDAAVRIGSTLLLIESHSMERPLDYEIGKLSVIEQRNKRFSEKLAQVLEVRELFKRNPKGPNFDITWASKIEYCVVSPFVEWIWTTEPQLWMNAKIPRILSVSELLHFLKELTP
jgi:hypothetical protein